MFTLLYKLNNLFFLKPVRRGATMSQSRASNVT